MLTSWEQAALADIECRLRRDDLELARVLEQFEPTREQTVVAAAAQRTSPPDGVAEDTVEDPLWPYFLVWFVVSIVVPGLAVGIAILIELLL